MDTDIVGKQDKSLFESSHCRNKVKFEEGKPGHKTIHTLIHNCIKDYFYQKKHLKNISINDDFSFASSGIGTDDIVIIKEEIEKKLDKKLRFDPLFYDICTVNQLYELVINDSKKEVFENEVILLDMDPMALISVLIRTYHDDDYFVYEKPKNGGWKIALGIHSALTLTPTTLIFNHFCHHEVIRKWENKGPFSAIARRFLKSEGGQGWNVYGQAAFEYAAQSRGIPYAKSTRSDDPLFSLVVPRSEITLQQSNCKTCITIRTRDKSVLTKIQELVTGEVPPCPKYEASSIDTQIGKENYQKSIKEILSEIHEGHFQKITFSRQVPVPRKIDMLATYLHARKKHTPSRTFLINFMGREVLGFSPELVMAVRGRKVSTQPLAGTHILTGNSADNTVNRKKLLSDPKEIVEHAMTVVAAINDVRFVSEQDTVKVDDFMSVLERGNVQHIASMVTGILGENKDFWDAFDRLFPSVTACGSPKEKVIEIILGKEEFSRGLYSGAVLMINENEFEASMVLRSVFQKPEKSWLQAGAGIFELSTPEREFEETREKLASIAPHIVFDS